MLLLAWRKSFLNYLKNSGRPGNLAKIYLFNGLSLTIEILEKCAEYTEG